MIFKLKQKEKIKKFNKLFQTIRIKHKLRMWLIKINNDIISYIQFIIYI